MVNNLKGLIGVVVSLANTTHNSASSMAETTKQVNQTMEEQVQSSIQQIASATNQVANTQEILFYEKREWRREYRQRQYQ